MEDRIFITNFALRKTCNECMVQINNPFIVYGYKGPAYFCDREQETERIVSALDSERNVTLVAPRRMGKTGLIKHVFNKIESESSETRCFYIDIYATHSIDELVGLLASTIIGKLDTVTQSVLRGIQTFFSRWSPRVSIDQMTGMPSVTLDIREGEGHESLKQVFEYMRQSGRRCYVAIDEFQQILSYGETGVEALMRSYIQFLPNVYFIFSGSQQHVMEQMFMSADRPFFQSSMVVALQGIDRVAYRSFANHHLGGQNREIDERTFDYVYDMARGVTWYVQSVLHAIYDHREEPIDRGLVDYVVEELVEEQTMSYQNYCLWLTTNQRLLLRAIAADGMVGAPLSQAFISRHRLPAASSVKTALRALEDKQLVSRTPEGYMVSDLFFSLWLRKHNLNEEGFD